MTVLSGTGIPGAKYVYVKLANEERGKLMSLLPGARYLFVKLANEQRVFCPDIILDNITLCDTDVLHPTCGFGHTYTVINKEYNPMGFIPVDCCHGREKQVWKAPTILLKTSVNKEGLTWREWYAAATLGKPCCPRNPWGNCHSTCPRLHTEYASPELRAAFQAGVDPCELVNARISEENAAKQALACGTAAYDAHQAQEWSDAKDRKSES